MLKDRVTTEQGSHERRIISRRMCVDSYLAQDIVRVRVHFLQHLSGQESVYEQTLAARWRRVAFGTFGMA